MYGLDTHVSDFDLLLENPHAFNALEVPLASSLGIVQAMSINIPVLKIDVIL